MSRRIPNPAAERAAQNAQTIKGLLKLEGNKMCADCKRNKHPRWASWNLGVFICIRCSGIHRGMGTHISRVKSVDLDAWTDEQLQSIFKWGNSRANKYWEAKLAVGHVPSESKIENFIRTKYESKRWVLDGPIPDPSTLEAGGDDDVPLSLVKKKQSIERSASQKTSQNHFQSAGLPQSVKSTPQSDLLENETSSLFGESSATSAKIKLPAKSDTAPPKQIKPADSLLGLDFFGTSSASPIQSTSSSPMTSVNSRPDLKQTILSLYATAPRPHQQQKQPLKTPQGIFGSMSQSPVNSTSQDTSLENSISDAFKSLNFPSQKTSSTAPNQSGSSAFSDLGKLSSCRSSISQTSIKANGGNFFSNISVAKPEQQPTQPSREVGFTNDFGAFDSAPGPSPTVTKNNISGLNMFDFSTSTSTPQVQIQKPNISPATQQATTVFNISQPDLQKSKNMASVVTNNLLSSSDNWVSNNAWASPTNHSAQNHTMAHQTSFDDSGWGNNNVINSGVGDGARHGTSGENSANPIVSNDEEFGDWGSVATATAITPVKTAGLTSTSTVSHKSAAGLASSDDLFSNVWS
ncbi:putative stromal membrane-associated protein [Golovinomyces cichoracearum]|uniref:Putative stromal membrane-associated protein n=1 Tax=Golovinomyces cichoracearum TaxID=62708 RepID=A0A420J2L0_9PEZI|nr:putative stromal membrane-associated protein [Golovinomyces cichoracearum]